MLLSKSCIYGLKASLLMASTPSDDYVSIKDMSGYLDISYHFLTKVLQQLTATGLMKTYRGPNGGIRLAKPSDEITLLQIVTAIDGYDIFTECVLGLPGCGLEKPCPMHDEWSITKQQIFETFKSKTLFESAGNVRSGKLRISKEESIDFASYLR